MVVLKLFPDNRCGCAMECRTQPQRVCYITTVLGVLSAGMGCESGYWSCTHDWRMARIGVHIIKGKQKVMSDKRCRHGSESIVSLWLPIQDIVFPYLCSSSWNAELKASVLRWSTKTAWCTIRNLKIWRVLSSLCQKLIIAYIMQIK